MDYIAFNRQLFILYDLFANVEVLGVCQMPSSLNN